MEENGTVKAEGRNGIKPGCLKRHRHWGCGEFQPFCPAWCLGSWESLSMESIQQALPVCSCISQAEGSCRQGLGSHSCAPDRNRALHSLPSNPRSLHHQKPHPGSPPRNWLHLLPEDCTYIPAYTSSFLLFKSISSCADSSASPGHCHWRMLQPSWDHLSPKAKQHHRSNLTTLTPALLTPFGLTWTLFLQHRYLPVRFLQGCLCTAQALSPLSLFFSQGSPEPSCPFLLSQHSEDG